MASDFNKDFDIDIATPPPDVPAEAVVPEDTTRPQTCPRQQPTEARSTEFCTHREVKPYAGSSSFDPEAWCGDCQYYKLRRVPKKRERTDEWGY